MNQSHYIDTSMARAFREHGFKATPQRIAIGRYVLNNTEHPTAKDIYYEVRKTHSTVSLGTIYATLNILKEVGLIQELNLPDGQARFDPNTVHHAHLICKKCGDIVDWIDPALEELITKISDDKHFVVDKLGLDIHGICMKCQKDGNT